ncbi:MAG: bifunctional 5,10-methylene-tetrahydrofolate dehydrogenase/5,10-methylene-tetrahydrofolate cyclohydrolase, partial [Acutalibacteraceae bacterium]
KPISTLMLNADATVTICHSKTQNLSAITSQADILVAAVGKPLFVKADMVKDGAVVIDVGIHRKEDGKLCGDVDFAAVEPKASYITPVPGGVGPMTIAQLMQNTVVAAKINNNLI